MSYNERINVLPYYERQRTAHAGSPSPQDQLTSPFSISYTHPWMKTSRSSDSDRGWVVNCGGGIVLNVQMGWIYADKERMWGKYLGDDGCWSNAVYTCFDVFFYECAETGCARVIRCGIWEMWKTDWPSWSSRGSTVLKSLFLSRSSTISDLQYGHPYPVNQPSQERTEMAYRLEAW